MRPVHSRLLLFGLLAIAKHVAIGAQLGNGLRGLRFTFATAGVVLVGLAFASLAEGRAQRLRLLAFDAATTLLAAVDLLHFRAFGDVPTVASLRSATQLVDVADAVIDLVRPQDALLLATLPVLVLPGPWPRVRKRRTLAIGGVAIALLAATALSSTAARRRHLGNAYYAGDVGVVTYHALDLASYVAKRQASLAGREASAREAKARLDARPPAAPSSLSGVAAGRNVLVLQLESFQATAVGRVVGGRPVTPNLDALAQESLQFTEYFEQANVGRTADAQFVSNCSLFGIREAPVAFEYAGNEFRCLPAILRDAGYHTALFQPLAPDFWNSSAFDPKLGFSEVRSARDFVADEQIGMGLSDRSFFRQLVPKLEQMPQPWYAFALSITSHMPYDDPHMPRTLEVGALEGTRAGNYLQAVHYTDAAVGQLVADLRASGLLDRTVLVIYGDHDGITRRSGNLADLVDHGEDELAWYREEQRVPLLVRLPGGAHAGARDTLGGQLDLAPTLHGLLGAPGKPPAFLGRDLLAAAEADPSVPFVDGTVLGRDRLFVAKWGRCFDAQGEAPLATCAGLGERWQPLLELNQLILERNLVPLLAGPPAPVATAP